MPHVPHRLALLPEKLQIHNLQTWYRRGFNDGRAGRPAMDVKGFIEKQAEAYSTGRADGTAVMRDDRPG